MELKLTKAKVWLVYGVLGVVGLTGGGILAQGGQPVIKVDNAVHDFGTVDPGIQVKYQFEIKNSGRQPLQIKKINVSCGCITDAHTDTMLIEPGQKTQLFVTWEAPAYQKEVQEVIEVETNDPARPMQQFVVQAKVEPQFSLEPAVINFGVVEAADLPTTEEITIEKHGLESMKDTVAFTSHAKYLETKVQEIKPKEWKMSLSLLADAPIGPIDGEVVVTPSWGGSQKMLMLGKIVGAISAEPEEIYVDNSEPKTGKETVHVQGVQEKVLHLRVLSVSSALEKLLQTNDVDDRMEVTYDLTSPTSPKLVKGSILLEADLQNGKTKRIIIPVTLVK